MKWNHIILEGYCTRKFSTKGDKYLYKIVDTKELKTEKIENKEYDPNYRTPRKPSYCKDRICETCFFKNCPHLAVGDLPDKEYKKIMIFIGKMYKEMDKK
jgi:hypothetical protein